MPSSAFFSRPGERLITLGGDPHQGTVTTELTHEALLEHWDNLRRWIAESRDDLRLQRRVTEAAEDWEAHERPAGLLWRGPNLDLLRELHRRNAADMTGLQTEFLAASERQQKREHMTRYANAVSIFTVVIVLGVAPILLWRDYVSWETTRPRARLINLATGEAFPLAGDIVFIGRPTEGVAVVKHQVKFRNQRISRIHFGVTNTGMATDWRSLYGTTINGRPLEYAHSSQLKAGDIIALSGIRLLAFDPIRWSRWDYLKPARKFNAKSPSRGWAMMVDGERRAGLPIVGNE